MAKPTPQVLIGKEKHPVYFGMATLSDFEEMSGIGIADVGSSMTLKNSFRLAYLGLKHGARRAKTECAFANEFDVMDLQDEHPETLGNIMEEFAKQYTPETEETDEAPDKKK